MSEIAKAFARAAIEQRTALLPYVMSGYPEPDSAVELALALERGGADILEVGMPFSDPLADGLTIQAAATTSLAGGTTVASCIQTAARIRQRSDIPMVLMGYYNPVLRYGVQRFCRDAAAAGVQGLILPDLPPEEAEEAREYTRDQGIDLIFLVAPTSTEARIARAAHVASGFLYCVSLTGVTGARASVSDGLAGFIARVRRHTELPLAVGFGISKPEHVRQVATVADGAAVASALIELIDRLPTEERLEGVERYMSELRSAGMKASPVEERDEHRGGVAWLS